jgi:hypothetical protein
VQALKAFLLAVSAGLAAGCNLPFTDACTTDFRHGVVVEVRDSLTDAPAAAGARLIVRDGAYADTSDQLPFTDPLTLRAAGERGGTYDVTVEKLDYRDWTRARVRVLEDECHVIPVRIEARLQPIT